MFFAFKPNNGNMRILSEAFTNGGTLPRNFTCNGVNVNPPITIFEAPTCTKSFAATIIDKDAKPNFQVHWFVFNIPARHTKIHQNYLPDKAICGESDNNSNRYDGPCPVFFTGKHRIELTVYALDSFLKHTKRCSYIEQKDSIYNHTLATAQIIAICEGTREAINTYT